MSIAVAGTSTLPAAAQGTMLVRAGRIVEDAPASRLDARTIEQIYERNGERGDR